MELRHLKYFVAVAEELHFRRAAERLNVSQPPLSQQIRQLELELGTTLFERTNRRVVLTQAGRLFLREARAVIEQAERAAAVARRAERGELGELRIGMFPSAPLVPEVAQAIRAYRAKFPGVDLVLNELESREQIGALMEERQDIAIVRSIDAPILPREIVSRRVVDEPLVVAMRRDNPLSRGEGPLPVASLAEEPFVFYGEKMGAVLPRVVLDLCHRARFEPRISQLANANSTMIGLVAAGLGVAILPQGLSRLSHPDLAIRPLAESDATVAVWLLSHGRNRSAMAEGFLALI
ncbi:LysR substrate-binding domain-containing protein [Rhodoligotrophos defluvii]|uniref:LysR substrate-binding domain-containing protein n=1 Tax=Rhodoligotrophos defluvii TaxID=2561934 RepID=UPI0010C9B63E|nr:LysR substrate-binding domain-containing protein [Rhodoligotrophos defluvii]